MECNQAMTIVAERNSGSLG